MLYWERGREGMAGIYVCAHFILEGIPVLVVCCTITAFTCRLKTYYNTSLDAISVQGNQICTSLSMSRIQEIDATRDSVAGKRTLNAARRPLRPRRLVMDIATPGGTTSASPPITFVLDLLVSCIGREADRSVTSETARKWYGVGCELEAMHSSVNSSTSQRDSQCYHRPEYSGLAPRSQRPASMKQTRRSSQQ